MNKAYDKIIFHNNMTPALNEDNLNAMSEALDTVDTRLVQLAGDVLEKAHNIMELSENPPYIGANGNWYTWDTDTGEYVDSGIDASITVSIADVSMLSPDASPYVTNTGTNTDPVFHLFIPRGQTGATGATPDMAVTATVDANTGTPSVQVTKTGTAENPSFALAFSNLKGATGQTGATGATPNITASATIDANTGTPAVTVTKTGTAENPALAFAFSNLKGVDGTVPITKYSQTLTAGSTAVVFDNVTTTANSIISVGTDKEGLEYNDILVSLQNEYTVIFDAQSSNVTVYLLVTEVA